MSEETVAQRVVDELDAAIARVASLSARLDTAIDRRTDAENQRDSMLHVLNAILLSVGGAMTVADEYTFGQPPREIEVDRQPGRMIVRFAPVAGPAILNSAGAPIARA